MQDTTPPAADFRSSLRLGLAKILAEPGASERWLAPDTVWDVAWPMPRTVGAEAVDAGVLGALRTAFAHVQRRDVLFIGGNNRRAEQGRWCATVTHYVGRFVAPFCGLLPSDRLVFLRSGEFYRLDDAGRIAEAKIIFDMPDLMRQSGRMPLPSLGTEITFPAPATQDGLCPVHGDGAASLDLVEQMLADLRTFDPETSSSAGQVGEGGAWADDMLWYGPAGIGSNYRWDGFVDHHRADFLRAFPDRVGGNHYCRIGDGSYAAVSGWPSMTMTHRAPYLGRPATGKALTLRVMDFYRCSGGRIAENWVCLDYGHLFHQMGYDLVAEANAL